MTPESKGIPNLFFFGPRILSTVYDGLNTTLILLKIRLNNSQEKYDIFFTFQIADVCNIQNLFLCNAETNTRNHKKHQETRL